jgi:hypothetical protein
MRSRSSLVSLVPVVVLSAVACSAPGGDTAPGAQARPSAVSAGDGGTSATSASQASPPANTTPKSNCPGDQRGFASPVKYGFDNQDKNATGSFVLAADVDGDGKLDLISGANEVGISVFRGKGDGTFEAGTIFDSSPLDTGRPEVSLAAVGDLNGDGKPDLVVASNFVTGRFDVVLNNGDGTFARGVRYDTDNGGGRAVALGDLNGDGKLDILVTGGNRVDVLIGKGDGSFNDDVPYEFDGNFGVDVADFNGDKKLDFVVASNDSAGDRGLQVVLSEKGDGTFGAAPPYYPTEGLAEALQQIHVGDLDGDGTVDIVLSETNASQLAVFMNKGNGTFKAQAAYKVGSGGGPFALADVNGDGKLDIAVMNLMNFDTDSYGKKGGLTILTNAGKGTFTGANPDSGGIVAARPGIDYPTFTADATDTASAIAVADLNGDGLVDVVGAWNELSSVDQHNQLKVLLGQCNAKGK